MHITAVRRAFVRVVGLGLIAILGGNGCGQKLADHSGKPYCGDKIVKAIAASPGADPEAVYVGKDDTVTWDPNGTTFAVEFKKDSPFVDDGKKFDNGNPKSKKAKQHLILKVYEYKITVNGQSYDPQVIGGGNP